MDNTAPEPNNFLNWVDIKNFKSIKDLHLDCKRVNVFIGKPNVGKSNILEGLGLLGVEYGIEKFMGGLARYSTLPDLFYDRDVSVAVRVYTDKESLSAVLAKPSTILNESNEEYSYEYFLGNSEMAEKIAESELIQIGEDESMRRSLEYARHDYRHILLTREGKVSGLAGQGRYITKYRPKFVKKYDFKDLINFTENSFSFLMPPQGSNLYSVVNRDEVLKTEFAKLFSEQQLDFVLSNFDQNFELQKKEGFYVVQYPFFSVADTFRRYMFYITAIESNRNSVIVFEEPEVHSFPPYVKAIAHRMVSSNTNQFFVSTHSPYLLQTLISELDESELAVYITYYQDYQTHVRQLTADELQEAQDLGIDLFYNLSRYEPNA